MTSGTDLRISPLTASVGARIEGIDLGMPLKSEQRSTLTQAYNDFGVLFFPDQELTDDEMDRFVRNFGEPVDMGYQKDCGSEEKPAGTKSVYAGNLTPTRRSTAFWHADGSWLPEPPAATALRAVQVPPVGGDTLWASMHAAYDALSEPFREMLDGLTAVHSGYLTLEREPLLRLSDHRTFEDENIHPVISVHPVTGRKAIYVSECMTTRIVELSEAESAKVLEIIFAHIRQPDFMVRWNWNPGDLAIWDNRAVQHYAVPDYTEDRILQRVELVGRAPVGPRTSARGKQEMTA